MDQEQGARLEGTGLQGATERPLGDNQGLARMRQRYDIKVGKLTCRCLIRKWKFCHLVKTLVGGKVTPKLIKCNEEGGKSKSRGGLREEGRER